MGFLLFNVKRSFTFSFLIGSIYGLSDEIHQLFVPYRGFSLFDILADVMGCLLGIMIFIYLKRLNWLKFKD